ncbi:MAG TPA: calcium/proton exchanger [Candidatus Dormibacteraeota bacterium]
MGIRLSREERVMMALLVFVPATVVAAHTGTAGWLQFVLSVAAIIPVAALIASATEALAHRLGGKVGGLLNATFGNLPDLLIGIFGVQKGLIPLVKATLVGALISNSALIMGLCFVAAGLVHRRPRFDRVEAGHHSVLMMLTVAAILFPTVGAFVICGRSCAGGPNSATIQGVSVGIAIALLVAYVAYVFYGILGFESFGSRPTDGRETRMFKAPKQGDAQGWPLPFSLGLLILMGLALIPVTDTLTSGVASVTKALGWTEVFVGMVIVANAGNAAEAYAAIKFAIRKPGTGSGPGEDSGLDLALGIASASSIQIATFVMPVVVLFSLFFKPMNLVFTFVEVSILALLVIVFTHTAQDGESNWLEGAQLVVLYAMAAVVFYALPASAFGG